jgi:hypothetical protein
VDLKTKTPIGRKCQAITIISVLAYNRTLNQIYLSNENIWIRKREPISISQHSQTEIFTVSSSNPALLRSFHPNGPSGGFDVGGFEYCNFHFLRSPDEMGERRRGVGDGVVELTDR